MAQVIELRELAADVCQRYEPSAEARALLQPGLTANDFLRTLDARHQFADGLRFAACALPSREAIWWGSLCVWSIYRPKPPDDVPLTLNAVVGWVQEPTEENRRVAETMIEAAGVDTPAGGLAAAIFFSGDNIAPADQPEVKPKAFLWSKLVAGAVVQATNLVPPDKKKECERQFLSYVFDVADGKTH